MSERYAVIGNPIHHSRSPDIHAAFARQTHQDIVYEKLLAPLDGFARTLSDFRAAGGKGVNVTVPFKEEALRVADSASERATLAGAANTLRFDGNEIYADNTDGIGLITDIQRNLGFSLKDKSILLMGAGGAARGVLGQLIAQQPRLLYIANRTHAKAVTLASIPSNIHPDVPGLMLEGLTYHELRTHSFDCVINATSASLHGELPPLPEDLFKEGSLAYDMMYGSHDTPFMQYARQHGASRVQDGLGMLVEQAASAFELWRGIHPDTAPVLAELRASLQNSPA